MKKHPVFIVSGGTFGHIRPALTVLKKLEKEGINSLFFCARQDKKFPLIKERDPNSTIFLIMKGIPPSYNPIKWLIFCFLLCIALLKVFFYFLFKKPKLVLAAGAFVSFPLLFWARVFKVPYIIMEQNSSPGLVSRLFIKEALNVFFGMDPIDNTLRQYEHLQVVGNPIDLPIVSKKEAIEYFNLPFHLENEKIFGVIGGSLGAKALLDWAKRQNKDLDILESSLLCITGIKLYQNYTDIASQRIYIVPFVKDIAYFYALCDIIISRSGASSISELFLYNKPTIFVPYPQATDNHQYYNAQFALKYLKGCIVEQHTLAQYSLGELYHLVLQDNSKKENPQKFTYALETVVESITKEL